MNDKAKSKEEFVSCNDYVQMISHTHTKYFFENLRFIVDLVKINPKFVFGCWA